MCFLKVRICSVEMQFLCQCVYSDSGSSLLSARNASVRIPKLSVNSEVHCSVCENKPLSDSVHNVGECTSVALEQNPVQDTLAALLAHSQSCRMKSLVKLN